MNLLSRKDTRSDNYMLNETHLHLIFTRAGWPAMIDICCDLVGGNALAPLFFSSYEDALKQLRYLLGKRIICNPVFHRVDEFRKLLEQAYFLDRTTKVIFIVPIRDNDKAINVWFKQLATGGKWGLLEKFSRDTDAFSSANKDKTH